MQKLIFRAIAIICVTTFASGVQAATVMIDPAVSDSQEAGKTFAVNVKIKDAAGLFGYQFDLAFDNTALRFSSVEVGGFLGNDGTDTLTFLKANDRQAYFGVASDILALLESSGQTEVTSEVNSAGVLTVVGTRLGSAANIAGAGILAVIVFEVLAVKESALELRNVQLGASLSDSDAQLLPVDTENGVIVVLDIKGDLNDDREVNMDDVILALDIAIGLIEPDARQKSLADMNDDGRIRSDDVLMILRKAFGAAAPLFSSDIWSVPPKRSALLPNFPNPFNPETWLPFTLSKPEQVTIRIYNSTGNLVRTLDLGQKPSGAYLSKEKAAYWDGRNENGETVASDVYFYIMNAGESIDLRKMAMVR